VKKDPEVSSHPKAGVSFSDKHGPGNSYKLLVRLKFWRWLRLGSCPKKNSGPKKENVKKTRTSILYPACRHTGLRRVARATPQRNLRPPSVSERMTSVVGEKKEKREEGKSKKNA